MSQRTYFIAVDLGAESGRVMLVEQTRQQFATQEIHRFANGPIKQADTLRWDVQKLFEEICKGIKRAVQQAGSVAGLGLDTWGVDFGLVDEKGKILENPYHYRDSRTEGMIEKADQIVGKWTIYSQTGIQFMPLNTLFQLLGCKSKTPQVLQKAYRLLFMPNLLMTMLGAKPCAEYTIASTSQMLNMQTGQWAYDLLNKLGLPTHILPEIVMPGTIVGHINPDIATNGDGLPIPIIAVGCHDTASAVAAVPVQSGRQWAYLSSGTWSLLGIETPRPFINQKTFHYSLTNEGGVENTIRLLKNIMGLWLVQECRRHWASEGQDYDYATLTDMAAKAKPFTAWLEVDDMCFFTPGNMPQKINDFLKKTGQQPITDKGQMVRVILESLAVRYHQVIRMLEDVSGNAIEVLHIIGGGSQNKLLNQLAADATGKTVITEPVEATVLGNALMQAKAIGKIASLQEGRTLIAQSVKTEIYSPKTDSRWKDYIQRFERR